jgi:hypothetical protein
MNFRNPGVGLPKKHILRNVTFNDDYRAPPGNIEWMYRSFNYFEVNGELLWS